MQYAPMNVVKKGHLIKMNKVAMILLDKQFEYHKNVPAEECYKQMQTKFNNKYAEWKKHFSLSLIRTPFYERTDRQYSFSIGIKPYGSGNEIYGYVEQVEGGSVVKFEIRPFFRTCILLIMIFFFILGYFGGWKGPGIVVSLYMIFFIPVVIIKSLCFLDCIEEILDTI